MKNKFFSIVSGFALLLLTGCLASNAVRTGSLDAGVYRSSTRSFSFAVPEGAKIFDAKQPLGEYVIVQNLPSPLIVQGVSSNRVVGIEGGISTAAKKDMIKSGHDFWAKAYSGSALTVIHEEWTTINGQTVYFTVSKEQPAGLLVQSNVFYGALSFLKDDHSYVVFDKVRTGKQFIGTKDLPEEARTSQRRKAIEKFYRTIKFR